LLSLEILQEIVLHHYWRSEEAKVNIQNDLDKKMALQSEPIYGINTGFGSLCNFK
jgi:histidine ammonia-lyase